MKLSHNFGLIKVIPDVPPVVPLDICLGVQLEVLTSTEPQTLLESYQPTLGPSDMSRPLKSQEKSSWWVGG